MTSATMTIEAVEKLARKIVAEFGISLEDARLLAEFNLRYAK